MSFLIFFKIKTKWLLSISAKDSFFKERKLPIQNKGFKYFSCTYPKNNLAYAHITVYNPRFPKKGPCSTFLCDNPKRKEDSSPKSLIETNTELANIRFSHKLSKFKRFNQLISKIPWIYYFWGGEMWLKCDLSV